MKILNNNLFKTGGKCFFIYIFVVFLADTFFILSFVCQQKKKACYCRNQCFVIPPCSLWSCENTSWKRDVCEQQNTGSSAALLLSPSSCCESRPVDLSLTANAPKVERAIKSSPKNRSLVSSCLSSSPLRQCRTSAIRQGGHWCSTVAATFRKKSKITALVTCPLFRSPVVFIHCVRALSLSLLTKILL